jgi:hypothetical protein
MQVFVVTNRGTVLLRLAAQGDALPKPNQLQNTLGVTTQEIQTQLETAIIELSLQAALAQTNAKKRYHKIASEIAATTSRGHKIERANLKELSKNNFPIWK